MVDITCTLTSGVPVISVRNAPSRNPAAGAQPQHYVTPGVQSTYCTLSSSTVATLQMLLLMLVVFKIA